MVSRRSRRSTVNIVILDYLAIDTRIAVGPPPIAVYRCESAKVVYSNVENRTEVNASAILLVARRVVPPPAPGVFQVGELLTLDYTDR